MSSRFYLVVIILLISSFAFGQGTWWQVEGPSNSSLYGCYFVTADTGWACGPEGTIWKTDDGGNSWTDISIGNGRYLRDIWAFNKNDIIIIGGKDDGDNDGYILKSNDGGETWSDSIYSETKEFYGIAFKDSIGYIVGRDDSNNNGLIYYSSDYGATWVPYDVVNSYFFQSVQILNDSILWMAQYDARVCKYNVISKEATIFVMPDQTWSMYTVQFLDASTGWAGGYNGYIAKTTDGGQTWSNADLGNMNHVNDLYFFNSDTGFLVQQYGEIYKNTTGSISGWTLMDDFDEKLLDIEFIDQDNGWIVGSNGIILKYYQGENVFVTIPDTVIASGTSNIKIPVYIDGVVSLYNIYSFQFQAGFDNSKLTFNGIDTVGTLSGGYTINYNNPTDSINLWAAGTKKIENNGILLYLDFDVEAGFSVGDTVEITFSSFLFNEGSPGDITNDGSIVLVGALEFYGDVNLDDQITQTDAEILMTYGIGDTTLNDTSKTAAEVTDNGTITAYDASYILQKVLNPSLVFPAGNTFVPKVNSTCTNWTHVRIPDTLFSYGTTSVEMPVTMSNCYSYLYSYQVKIGYDNSKITFTGIDTVGTYSGGSIIKYKNVPSDTIIIWSAKGTAWSPYSCERIINLKFDIDPSFQSSDSAAINFSYFMFNEGDPTVYTYNGVIRITPHEFSYGDVSLDETISSYDASVLLSYGIGDTTLNDTSKTAAEVSGNGTITAYDASLILRYVVGYISSFPAGSTFTMKYDLSNTTALYALNETAGEYIDYTISINNAADVFSSNIDLEYSGVELVSYKTTDITSGYLTADRRTDTGVRIALAGSEEMSTNGEILRLRFRRISEDYSINLRKFVANEVEIEVLDSKPEVPSNFALSQNYPNPFNPETNIKYQIPENSHVVLKIYNILGQEVRTLVYEEQPAGFYNIKWNGANNNGVKVSSGVYVYRIKAGKYSKTMKMVYLR